MNARQTVDAYDLQCVSAWRLIMFMAVKNKYYEDECAKKRLDEWFYNEDVLPVFCTVCDKEMPRNGKNGW